jgi:hypothetical protein
MEKTKTILEIIKDSLNIILFQLVILGESAKAVLAEKAMILVRGKFITKSRYLFNCIKNIVQENIEKMDIPKNRM